MAKSWQKQSIRSGACQARCPAGAIDKTKGCANGKDQTICGPYVMGSKLPPHGPKQLVRYGCGKCQVGVPCESGIPSRKSQATAGQMQNA